MSRFKIDDPDLDVAALEARVEAAIEAKRGTRFTDDELDELRNTPLQPRLRREDLPRGLIDELSERRGRLPRIEPAPPPVTADIAATRDADLDRTRPLWGDLVAAMHSARGAGLRGAFVAVSRRLMRPFYRATLNLDPMLEALALRDDRYFDHLERRLERSVDRAIDALDARMDQTQDWAGDYLSEVTGQLEKRHERLLHLSHNVVYELTNARLDLTNMQDRLNETARRIAMLEGRMRALEKLALSEPAGAGHGPEEAEK